MKKGTLALLVCTGLLAAPCFGSTIVAPNANAAAEGNNNINGSFQGGGITFQWVMAASQFGAVPVGSSVTAIGFRLDGGVVSQPAADETYTNWNLQLSKSLNAPGSLSGTFASNIGADVTTVLSGPLTVNAGSFTGGAGPNPFFFVNFTTPYTYTGGDLLVTLRHDSSTSGFGTDGVTLASLAGIGDTVLNNNFTATTGTAQLFNMPVTAFQFTSSLATPEPSTWLSLAGGLALILVRTRRRSA